MRRYLLASMILALLVTALAAGCSGEPVSTVAGEEPTAAPTRRDVEPEPTAPQTLSPPTEAGAATATPVPEATEGALPAGAEAPVNQAREDLARRLDLPSVAIRLLSVEAVKWPDVSLGCPQHRLLYPDVVTPGFLIVLEADSQTYEYHTDTNRLLVLCGDHGRPTYPVIPVDPREIKDGEPWLPVD
jgi:hypothetical protein